VLLTWYRFVRVLRKITYQMDEAMQELDLSRSQLELLIEIAFEKGVNQQTCANRMNVTKGNIAQHIARLERDELVQRHKDGRTNHLYLTEKGEDLVASIMPIHDQRVKEILSVLSPEELRQFQSILRKFDRSFN
jgi:MarR family 2-MHQ and catechol resistance regulon transcriptional repressor